MFASNVAPKRRIREKPTAWWCEICDHLIKAYHATCSECGNTRPE